MLEQQVTVVSVPLVAQRERSESAVMQDSLEILAKEVWAVLVVLQELPVSAVSAEPTEPTELRATAVSADNPVLKALAVLLDSSLFHLAHLEARELWVLLAVAVLAVCQEPRLRATVPQALSVESVLKVLRVPLEPMA